MSRTGPAERECGGRSAAQLMATIDFVPRPFSFCRCAGPAVTIPRWTAGLQATAFGWASWRLAPQLSAGSDVTTLGLRAPTPFGVVGVAVTTTDGYTAAEVVLPAGMPGVGQGGVVCVAGPADTTVPPAACDALSINSKPVANPVAWGRFLCTPPLTDSYGTTVTVLRSPCQH